MSPTHKTNVAETLKNGVSILFFENQQQEMKKKKILFN